MSSVLLSPVGIDAISFVLASEVETNADLKRENPDWDVDRIYSKTGISQRHVVKDDTTALDLAQKAAEKMLLEYGIEKKSIDYLILCTQSADFFLPTSACVLQSRLGLNNSLGAIDVNQGCSGYIYSLGLAKGLIVSGQAKNVLVLTSDTYSKYINKRDRSVRTLFGDGASATLVRSRGGLSLGGFCYGTDGFGAENLIVPMGGCRNPIKSKEEPHSFVDSQGNERSDLNLYMNGSAIMEFALKRLPEVFNASAASLGFDLNESEYFCFHQANKFMLEMIRKRLRLPEDRMILEYSDVGNTVSSSIPIALSRAITGKKFKKGDRIALVGFGVGYSWGATYLEVQ